MLVFEFSPWGDELYIFFYGLKILSRQRRNDDDDDNDDNEAKKFSQSPKTNSLLKTAFFNFKLRSSELSNPLKLVWTFSIK